MPFFPLFTFPSAYRYIDCGLTLSFSDRHPALRTVFAHGLGGTEQQPLEQVVLRHVKAEFIHLYTEDDRGLEMLENYSPLSYELGSLPHRLILLTSSSGKCFARLDLSHAITDCYSFALMMYELALAYDGYPFGTYRGAPCNDFVEYIYNRPSVKTGHTYWNKYLEGCQPSHLPSLLNKDTGISGLNNEPRRLKSTSVTIPLLTHEMSAFCRKYEITVFHVFQTAWALVLGSYINSNDVCFGYTTSGRDAPVDGIETAVGSFFSTLVCRVTMDQSMSILSILKEVQAHTTVSLDHQHYSIADMQGTETPQFNTIIAFQKAALLDRKNTTFRVDQISVYDPSEVCYVSVLHDSEALNSNY